MSTLAITVALVCGASAAAQPDAGPTAEDRIVDDFIRYDIGQLPGEPGRRAYAAFNSLQGDAAVAALVRGVNKAARIGNSCPIIVICGRLQSLLPGTQNRDLLASAFRQLDSSGSGVYYANYVENMRQLVDQRLAAVSGEAPQLRRQLQGGGTASQLRRARIPMEEWSCEDLAEAVTQEKDAELVSVLEELKGRQGAQHTDALARAIEQVDEQAKHVARGLLAQRLLRMTDRTLQAKLQDPNAEVRAAAARAIGYKGSPLLQELVAALQDRSPLVVGFAHESLVKLTGEDFGPDENASVAESYSAKLRWEKYLSEQAGPRPQQE